MKVRIGNMRKVEIRTAKREDLQEMLDIYNYEVVNGVATLDLEPKTLEERKVWFDEHNVENHPLIVAVDADKVVGYASLSAYREKEAYRSTVELSIYIHQDARGQKVASQLMDAILQMAREDARTHTVVSVITSGNQASTRLHDKFGFHFCGMIPEVGQKFGVYQNIDNYSLNVDRKDAER